MFEKMIELMEQHAKYGPAMKEAALAQRSLVLNYHTHGGPSGWCVSVCAKEHNPLQILGQAENLEELVHISGVSKEEGDIDRLMPIFGEELKAHYKLEKDLVVFKNGKPYVKEP